MKQEEGGLARMDKHPQRTIPGSPQSSPEPRHGLVSAPPRPRPLSPAGAAGSPSGPGIAGEAEALPPSQLPLPARAKASALPGAARRPPRPHLRGRRRAFSGSSW